MDQHFDGLFKAFWLMTIEHVNFAEFARPSGKLPSKVRENNTELCAEGSSV
jgi:hypothetical protein